MKYSKMEDWIKYYVVITCMFFSLFSSAQKKNLSFLHFTTEMGLSNSDCRTIVQDKEGFMWIGTADGLNRFDGVQFKVYRKKVNDTLGIQDNVITKLFVDSKGILWVGTERNGLCRYNKEKDVFITYKRHAKKGSIDDNNISDILEDRKGRIWISTFRGLNLFDSARNCFVNYGDNPNITIHEIGINLLIQQKIPSEIIKELLIYKNKTIPISVLESNLSKKAGKDFVNKYIRLIKSVFKYGQIEKTIADVELKEIKLDDDGNILIGYSNGMISIFNPDTRIFQHFGIVPKTGNMPVYVNTVCAYNRQIWVGTTNTGVWVFELQTKKWKKFDLFPGNNVKKIIKDHKGNLWFGSLEDGLFFLDKRKNIMESFKHDDFDKYSLSVNSVYDIYEDRLHNFWICENLGALDMTIPKVSFNSYKHSVLNSKGLSYSNVTAVLEDNNKLWVGYYDGGLDIIDRNSLEKKFYNFRNGPGTVHCIFKDKNSNIWLGTYRGGLLMFDKKSNRFIAYKNNVTDTNSISGNDVRRITEDSKGNLWLATQGTGINKFDLRTKTFKHYRVDYSIHDKTICTDWVFTVYCDKTDNIWVGTNYGLSCINEKKRYVKSYIEKPDSSGSISSNVILSIYEDSKGNLWFGTLEGLNLFDPKTETFKAFTRRDGLPNDIITGIVEDSQGYLWLSTYKGLSRFSLKDYTSTNFDISSGLEIDEFIHQGGYKNENGEIFFGGRQGLICFVPDELKFNDYAPSVYFTDFKIYNKSVPVSSSPDSKGFFLEKQITYTKDIAIKYDQNVFTFEFAALNYVVPERNLYAYKMEGFDKEWNEVGHKHDATYTNLPPGNYTFKVKASNNDGVWNETGTSININIKPPFWKTIWAKVVYMLIAILLLIWFRYSILQRERYRKGLKFAQMEAEKEQEIVLTKLRFFSNITHEFRTPLTLILGPSEKLINSDNEDKNKDQYNLIYRNAQRLLRLVNQLMDVRKLEAGGLKMEVSQNDIVKFVFETAGSFNFEAQERKINFTINSEEKSILVWFDKDKLDKILYNLISNAFKFTPDGGTISINIQVNKSILEEVEMDCVEITINDSGIGIPSDSLPHVFERFYQAENSPAGQGTGIGLALTKELVELHNGKIKAERNPSGGAKFTFTIPLGREHFENYQLSNNIEKQQYLISETEEHIEEENAEFKQTEELAPSKMPLLLIVEDNRDLRLFIKNEFKTRFKVIEAKDGMEGFETATDRMPDLIISDVMMPRMEGFELCKKLKTDERTCHIPIIMLTALSSDEKMITGLETGADDYIVKPFSLSILKAKVHNLIESRNLLRKQFLKMGELTQEVVIHNNLDQNFLQKVYEHVEKNLSNAEYSSNKLADDMNVSRSLLYKKIDALTGMSVHEYMRSIKLKKAAILLKSQKFNVSETASEVGFNDISYFIKCFSKQFGCTPSKYISSQEKTHNS